MNKSDLERAYYLMDALSKFHQKVDLSLALLSDCIRSIYLSDSAEDGDLPKA